MARDVLFPYCWRVCSLVPHVACIGSTWHLNLPPRAARDVRGEGALTRLARAHEAQSNLRRSNSERTTRKGCRRGYRVEASHKYKQLTMLGKAKAGLNGLCPHIQPLGGLAPCTCSQPHPVRYDRKVCFREAPLEQLVDICASRGCTHLSGIHSCWMRCKLRFNAGLRERDLGPVPPARIFSMATPLSGAIEQRSRRSERESVGPLS
jgi:hypothetical protein